MSDLAALQDRLAQALLDGDLDAVAPAVRRGPILADEALSVHRNTALHGLVNALRLSHPTVDALVGEAFFDQAALAFARAHPPAGAWLTGYGAGFAAFLQTYGPAADLPYLADVARFDFAVEAVAGLACGVDGASVDLGEAVLTLDASLTLIPLDYPAAAIRDALDQDEDALGRIDMRPRRHGLAIWRLADGAGLRVLSPVSADVLAGLMQDGDLEAVVGDESDLTLLQTEVFAAPFVRIAAKAL
jgi:hypothetical protein